MALQAALPPDAFLSWMREQQELLSESHRCRIVRLVFVVYLLLIFEGALRKWVAPEYRNELFFVRDPFVLVIYFLSLNYKIRVPKGQFMLFGIVMGWLAGLLILFKMSAGDIWAWPAFILAAYGWRQYFFYIPLAFVIGGCFNREDLNRLVRLTLLLSIPIAVLAYAQSLSPASAPINAGVKGNFEPMAVALGIPRVSGTFTSPAAFGPFAVSVLAMVLWLWVMPAERRPLGGVLLGLATLSAVANLAVSGNRGAFVQTALIVIAAVGSGAVLPTWRLSKRVLKVTIGLVAIAVVIAPLSFARQLQAMLARAAPAPGTIENWYEYDIVTRSIDQLVNFTALFPDTPLLGYQLGSGGNAVDTVLPEESFSRAQLATREDDWARNIIDLGPLFGSFYILFRIVLVLSLLRGAIAATRRLNDPLPLILFGFIGIILLSGQITAQGSINGYGWMFAGFCLAANSATRLSESPDVPVVLPSKGGA